MEGLLSCLKFVFSFKWFRHSTSMNNRTAEVGDIKGSSNVVNLDQSVKPVIVSQSGQSRGDEIRVKSARAVWEAVQEIRRIPKAAMFHIDIAHGDIPDSLLFANPNYIEDKKTLRQELNQIREVGDCKEHEPYVSPRLWALFDSYRILSARPLAILWYEGNLNARRWWEDEIIRDVLARNHIPEELRGFAPSNAIKTPHRHALNLIEQEISAEIRRMTIGKS